MIPHGLAKDNFTAIKTRNMLLSTNDTVNKKSLTVQHESIEQGDMYHENEKTI